VEIDPAAVVFQPQIVRQNSKPQSIFWLHLETGRTNMTYAMASVCFRQNAAPPCGWVLIQSGGSHAP
jgi:hypothetical protein